MKKVKILFAILGAILLTGCSFRPVTEMYRLPKRSDSFQDLQSAIDAAMVGLEYCAPLAGEQRQTVQMADIDGDREDEYLLFAKGGSDQPMRILIFDKVADSFVHLETIHSSGTGFDQVEYVQMDGEAGVELVVGRRLNDQVVRTLSVYSFRGGCAEQILTAGYSKYLSTNLDEDPEYELVVIRPGETETDRGIVEMYSFEDSNAQRSVEVNMSESVDNIKRILPGKLYGGENAVYIASTVGDSALITDVYAVVDGVFTNLTFSNESGTSVATMRNYYVYAEDIDGDGVVELPSLINMRSVSQRSATSDQYLIRWYAMTRDGGEVDKLCTYHNFLSGWYLKVSSERVSDLVVQEQGNDYTFSLWDEATQTLRPVLTVSVLTGQNRQEQGESDGRFVLYSTESVVYAAKLEQLAVEYGVSNAEVIQNFRLIHQEWKTGET